MTLTDRDAEILDALTLRVRVLSIPQIARTWWPDAAEPERAARTRLKALETEGLVHRFSLLAHPEIELTQPVFAWNMIYVPTQKSFASEFSGISWRLRCRWSESPHAIPAVIASTRAANLFSGHGGRYPRAAEHTHDLHLSQVFLRKRESIRPQFWISEERLRTEMRDTGFLPDAMIRLPEHSVIIEFGGAYSKSKIERFHRFCVEGNLPYELW